jgi:type IV secretion system protein VirD4
MNDIRLDEAFVIVRGARPLRCGRAIYFRRPELVARVRASRFNRSAAE